MKLESGRTLRPRNNLVYVRLEKQQEGVTAAGVILLPDEERQASFGQVVAVGPGELVRKGSRKGGRIPVCVEPGERVVFNKYGGATIRVEGEDLLVINEEHVLGAVES